MIIQRAYQICSSSYWAAATSLASAWALASEPLCTNVCYPNNMYAISRYMYDRLCFIYFRMGLFTIKLLYEWLEFSSTFNDTSKQTSEKNTKMLLNLKHLAFWRQQNIWTEQNQLREYSLRTIIQNESKCICHFSFVKRLCTYQHVFVMITSSETWAKSLQSNRKDWRKILRQNVSVLVDGYPIRSVE